MWNSLTSVGKAPTCPGECVHAITSIFCDNVLEEVTCGANFLRCCVPHEFSFGTPVETSAPISDNENSSPQSHSEEQIYSKPSSVITSTTTPSTTTTTKTTEAQPITSHPLMIRPHSPKPYYPSMVYGSVNLNKLNPMPTPSSVPSTTKSDTTVTPKFVSQKPTISSESSSVSEVSETQMSQSSVSSLGESCPGVCIKLRYVRYCSNILSNGKCLNDGDQCCLQSEVDFDNTSNIVTVVQQSDSSNASKEQPSDQTKLDIIPQILDQNKDSPPTTPMPLCEGTCVAPLFSLLCDETDYNLYCPNGGSCCVNREPITEAPQLKPCPGSCIPTILSGMCNRPSELILKTLDCTSGSICCHNPHETNEDSSKDVLNQENSHPIRDRPLMPPIVPQNNPQNYNPILFGSENNPIPVPLFVGGPPIQRPPHNVAQNAPPPMHNVPIIPMPAHPTPPRPSLVPKQEPPRPLPPPPFIPEPELMETDIMEPIDSLENQTINVRPPGGPPFCPGPCIAPMFR